MTTHTPVLAVYARLTAFAHLYFIKGNHAPYFSLTGELRNSRGMVESCGCLHSEILQRWPEFSDLASMHLSDIYGVPMHAETNSWYQLAGALPDHAGERYHAGNSQQHFPLAVVDPAKPWQTTEYRLPTADECLQAFADYVRIDIQTAQHVMENVLLHRRTWFSQWIQEQKPRWQAEASACIAKYKLQVTGDTWEVR